VRVIPIRGFQLKVGHTGLVTLAITAPRGETTEFVMPMPEAKALRDMFDAMLNATAVRSLAGNGAAAPSEPRQAEWQVEAAPEKQSVVLSMTSPSGLSMSNRFAASEVRRLIGELQAALARCTPAHS
jgi:hypothetical protein